MNDALLVRLFQGFGNLLRKRERVLERDRTALQALGQVLALDELHGEEVRGRAVRQRRALEAVHVGDVGMVEGREQLRLTLEARQALRVARQLLRQHLDRDVASELRVGGAIHLAHPAGADRGGDAVVRERAAHQCEPPWSRVSSSYQLTTTFSCWRESVGSATGRTMRKRCPSRVTS
jgi:hypothetical protein